MGQGGGEKEWVGWLDRKRKRDLSFYDLKRLRGDSKGFEMNSKRIQEELATDLR